MMIRLRPDEGRHAYVSVWFGFNMATS